MSESTATPVAPPMPGSETAPAAVPDPAPVATETAAVTEPTASPASPAAETVTQATDAAAAPSPTADVTPAASAEATPAAPEQGADAEAAAGDAAPVYTDFTFPEGVKVDPELLSKAREAFGKYNLPQDAAQELVNLHTEAGQKLVDSAFAQATEFWNAKSKEWVAEVGQMFGNQLNTNLERARGVWTEVLPDETDRNRLFDDLSSTKIGDHPILAKAMSEVGRRLQQVMQLTGTTTWADAIKKLREPAPPPPGTPSRTTNGAGRPADRRYANQRNQGA